MAQPAFDATLARESMRCTARCPKLNPDTECTSKTSCEFSKFKEAVLMSLIKDPAP